MLKVFILDFSCNIDRVILKKRYNISKMLVHTIARRIYVLLFMLGFCYSISFAQSLTVARGTVKDAKTKEVLPFASIKFEKSEIGAFSDEDGEFRVTTSRRNLNVITISLLGYKSQSFTVEVGRSTHIEALLEPEDRELTEVVVRPKKEKYSKKNNPAVELIKKVIAHKDENNITNLDYYQYKEYERIFFAFNEFKPDKQPFKRYDFLPKYIDTSLIDHKLILPFSVREKISDVYYRKDPKSKKRIVSGYQIEGVDQSFETEGLDAIIKETFKDVSIFDNSVMLLFQQFVSPLSEHSAVNFYRWYLSDTVKIDNDRYVKLDFAPFNSRDIGFTGNLYISLDSMFAVKRAVIRTPKKMNINFVEELIIRQEFEKTADNKWIPKEERMAIDVSMVDAVKFYIDKTRTYSDFTVNDPMDPVFVLDAPEVLQKDYEKRDKQFWANNRPETHKKDYKMDQMVEDIKDVTFFKVLLEVGKIVSTGYIPTSSDPDRNVVDIGKVTTFYSYNPVEKNRFRLTLSTTKNFHPHLFLYGYGAYGTGDNKFKYYGEAVWTFNKVQRHKDEFPRNNVTVAYKYDLNTLGQRYTQAERDNIMMSLRRSSNVKMTYNRAMQIGYNKEYYSGFSFNLTGQIFNETPAGKLVFEKMDEEGNIYNVNRLKTTEAMLSLRYAPNEKFFQQRRKRHTMPSPKFVINLTHTMALEDVFGGQYHYNKTSFSILKEFWMAPYGKLGVTVQAEKIWGETPFPFLITPSANNSYTIQRGNYYLIEPLEFVHDAQVSWEVYYHLNGWLFNRIPLLKVLKLREVVGFRGFIGELSNRNNPIHNRDLLIFPQNTFTTRNKPYMEYNIGIENIFKLFRIDYVRRLNYLDHPDVDKDGFRISFELNF